MAKEIVLKFKSGQIKVEAQGFKGSSCQEASKFLRALGEVTNDERKAEWFEENLELNGSIDSNLCG
jgi:hypothetical protein